MTAIEQSNSLADLAARIKSEHEAVSTALKDSVRHAITAGELLVEAKGQLKHGQWLPWLRDHCTFSERTAQLYMRCAKSRAEIEANTQCVADLTLNEAAAMLALSSDVKKLFEFFNQVKRLSDPEEIMQLCLDSGIAAFTIDYDSGYSVEERREWDLFILFLVRHIRWPSDAADNHVCWLKRHDFKSPSEWMGEEGDKWRDEAGVSKKGGFVPEPSDEAKQYWQALLAETKDLNRAAINKLIAEEHQALVEAIAAAPRSRRKARRSLRLKGRAA